MNSKRPSIGSSALGAHDAGSPEKRVGYWQSVPGLWNTWRVIDLICRTPLTS